MFGFLWGYALGKSSNGKPDKGFGQIMVIVLLMLFIGGCIVFFFFGGAKLFFGDGDSFGSAPSDSANFARHILDVMDLSQPLKKE